MDPDMAMLKVGMLMTDGYYCFFMSLVLVGTLIALFLTNRSISADRREKYPETLSEAIRNFWEFDLKVEACVMGLESEVAEVGRAMVEEACADHIVPSLRRREFNELVQQMLPNEALAIRRAFRNYRF